MANARYDDALKLKLEGNVSALPNIATGIALSSASWKFGGVEGCFDFVE